jgi:molybdopterin converting factor small subunit
VIRVHIPAPMRGYCEGKEVVEANGRNIRQLILSLDHTYPGMKAALMDNDLLKPDVAVAVDGQITPLGLLKTLSEASEVSFFPAIGGG